MLSRTCCVGRPYRKPFLRLLYRSEAEVARDARVAPVSSFNEVAIGPTAALVVSAKQSIRHAHATRLFVSRQATGRSAPCCSYYSAHAAAAVAVGAVECRNCPWRTSVAHTESQQAPACSHLRSVSTAYRYCHHSPNSPLLAAFDLFSIGALVHMTPTSRASAVVRVQRRRSSSSFRLLTPLLAYVDAAGIGPSSSHTLGPFRAAGIFIGELEKAALLERCARLKISLYGSLALTGAGHMTAEALMMVRTRSTIHLGP